ncbi:MAG: hypothetical protein ABIP79_06640 [Chitinophagaceae bacterium]
MQLFIVNGTINFDLLNLADYKGDYRVTMMLIPTDMQQNGVSISIITKSSSDSLKNADEVKQILNSLEFDKK